MIADRVTSGPGMVEPQDPGVDDTSSEETVVWDADPADPDAE